MRQTVFLLIFGLIIVFGGNLKTEALTQDEALESVRAATWKDPELVFYVGEIVGFMRYCKPVTSATVKKSKENVTRWLRLASSRFDAEKKRFIVDQALLKAMVGVFEKGISRGKKEGKFASSDSYEWNKGCKEEFGHNPNSLTHKLLQAPKFNLGRE